MKAHEKLAEWIYDRNYARIETSYYNIQLWAKKLGYSDVNKILSNAYKEDLIYRKKNLYFSKRYKEDEELNDMQEVFRW